ncbi:MAG TPA: hypothetical protein ENJ04_03520, partial [Nitrospirae bacterium]|nr:hypothetical protein [Nitrospirota bacterium]
IDEEVRGIVREAYRSAKDILTENSDILDSLAKLLLEKETLDSKEIDALIEDVRSKRTVET